MFRKSVVQWQSSPKIKGGVTTNLVGGLGNQLFLFANLIATAERHSKNSQEGVVVPMLPREASSSSVFEPRPTYWKTMFKGLDSVVLPAFPRLPAAQSQFSTRAITIPENKHQLDPSPISLPVSAPGASGLPVHNLVGFFQSESYFADCRDIVRQVLFPQDLQEMANLALRSLLPAHDRPFPSVEDYHLVGIHIRRGDYLKLSDTFEVLQPSYYSDALKSLFGAQLLTPPQRGGAASSAANGGKPVVVLLFCEDKDYAKTFRGWLMNKFPFLSEHCVVVEDAPEQLRKMADSDSNQLVEPEVLELLMMAQCQDLVIANSSFSWWSAWLATSETPKNFRRVIAPVKWFVKEPYPATARYYCPGWTVM